MDDLDMFFEELYGDYSIEDLKKVARELTDDSYVNHALGYWLLDKITEKNQKTY